MKRAGCSGLYLGLESGSERVLKSIGKKINPDDIVRGNQFVRDSGILAETSVLLGLPDEGREDMRRRCD